jgi:tetratricopeptide (TPR) repeat protein
MRARNTGDSGFYLHADGCADVALMQKPQHAPALALKSLALLNNHRFAAARDLAHDMLARDPEDLMALATLADALLELGDVEGASAATQQMMDLKPSLPSYARASHLLWLRGDVVGALRASKSAYDAGRGQADEEPVAWVLTEAAHMFRMQGDIAGAARGYAMALDHKPDFVAARVGRARCSLADGDVEAAIADLQGALINQPLVETAWLLAHAYELKGEKTAAQTALQQAIRIGEQTDGRSLALLLASENIELDRAQHAIERDGTERAGIYGDDVRALVYWRQGRLDDAKAAIEKATALGTPDPRLRVHRALIFGDDPALAEAMKHGGDHDPMLVALVRP